MAHCQQRQTQTLVRVLDEDLVLVDWGPTTLTVSAWYKGKAVPVIAAKAARVALKGLRTLADFKGFLKKSTAELPAGRVLPRVVERAFYAARAVSHDLTSLAAVAGAMADEVATGAFEMGADKVLVNNGGDIALKLVREKQAVVGIKPPLLNKIIGRLHVSGKSEIGGVASSGWDGRSHSPGVADMVTVWSGSAGLADAAATFIAGKTNIRCKNVLQRQASDIDPQSDLDDMRVTENVLELTSKQRRQALDQGTDAAKSLYRKNLIRGCLLVIKGDSSLLDPEGIMEYPA